MILNPACFTPHALSCVGATGRSPRRLRSFASAFHFPTPICAPHLTFFSHTLLPGAYLEVFFRSVPLAALISSRISSILKNCNVQKTIRTSPITPNLICFRVKPTVKYRHPNPFTYFSKMSLSSSNVSQKHQISPYFPCQFSKPPIPCPVSCLIYFITHLHRQCLSNRRSS